MYSETHRAYRCMHVHQQGETVDYRTVARHLHSCRALSCPDGPAKDRPLGLLVPVGHGSCRGVNDLRPSVRQRVMLQGLSLGTPCSRLGSSSHGGRVHACPTCPWTMPSR